MFPTFSVVASRGASECLEKVRTRYGDKSGFRALVLIQRVSRTNPRHFSRKRNAETNLALFIFFAVTLRTVCSNFSRPAGARESSVLLFCIICSIYMRNLSVRATGTLEIANPVVMRIFLRRDAVAIATRDLRASDVTISPNSIRPLARGRGKPSCVAVCILS